MMEHVRHFDWCSSVYDRYFVEEADIDNCSTEKILRNKFVDPLLSSDSDDDDQPNQIDWDEVFDNKEIVKHKLFVPCLRAVPPYPKLSALNTRQHNMMLKVLSAENPRVLEDLFLGKATRQEMKAFEAAKETYLKEQKEYKEWAKSLWTTDHCIRALRPKPAVENVYEAEYLVKAQRMRSLPKQYDCAAQITLESKTSEECEAVLKQELISVSLADMPLVKIPEKIERQFTIIRPCTMPQPCHKHPYQIILPNEDSLSMLPITEIHRELALFALNNGSQHIASENALKCLVQWNRQWMLPLSVCETIGTDGEKVNVLVLDSEFSTIKEAAPVRTYKAFRHLLEHALIPSSERERVLQRMNNTAKKKEGIFDVNASAVMDNVEMTSDDEDHNLIIDTGEDIESHPNGDQNTQQTKNVKSEENKAVCARIPVPESECSGYVTRAVSRRISDQSDQIGIYSCTCEGTLYEKPPRRSFKRWQFQNKVTNEKYDIIIHCPHKARDTSGELILEPIPEYQIDLGASEQSLDSIRSLALSLALRKNASILNVRVDGPSGEVARLEVEAGEQFRVGRAHHSGQALAALTTTLAQLQGLLPGHYVLQHEPHHGSNALLLSPVGAGGAGGGGAGGGGGGGGGALLLSFGVAAPGGADQAQLLSVPPTITTDLLPFHKFRRVLPCAFTSFDNQLVKEPKKPPPKKKAPPQALKWPKRKKNKKRKNW